MRLIKTITAYSYGSQTHTYGRVTERIVDYIYEADAKDSKEPEQSSGESTAPTES